jgi:hypothetical protein
MAKGAVAAYAEPVLASVFLVLAAHSAADVPLDPARGSSLMRGCQAEMRLMALPTLEDAPPLDLINGAYCIGYLNGFVAALPSANASICTKGASMGELVRSYVEYMQRNALMQDEDKRLGLRLALEAAYPCS